MSDRWGVFVDRDGVVTELVWDERLASFESPYSPQDVTLIPGAAGALRRLRAAGVPTVAVSNQPAFAKGTVARAHLDAVHARVIELLDAADAALDEYRYCFHHPDGVDAELARTCDCRKPAPGLLLEAAAALGLDVGSSWMIGDADTDVEAGRRAGCSTILVENPRSSHRRNGASEPDHRAHDLAEAADIVLAQTR